MTRIDRKTGEPILSPKLTDDQLYAMANEPGWRPWMRLIAEHPTRVAGARRLVAYRAGARL